MNYPRSRAVAAYTNVSLAGQQYKGVSLSGQIISIGTAGVVPWGILQNEPENAKQAANVVIEGTCPALLGGTVAQHALLACDADGALIPSSTGNVQALEAGVAGDVIDVLVKSSPSTLTGTADPNDKTFTFSAQSTQWVVTHNETERRVVAVKCFDTEGIQFEPDDWEATSVSVVTISHTVALAGTVTIRFADDG